MRIVSAEVETRIASAVVRVLFRSFFLPLYLCHHGRGNTCRYARASVCVFITAEQSTCYKAVQDMCERETVTKIRGLCGRVCVYVCVYYCSTYYKAVRVRRGGNHVCLSLLSTYYKAVRVFITACIYTAVPITGVCLLPHEACACITAGPIMCLCTYCKTPRFRCVCLRLLARFVGHSSAFSILSLTKRLTGVNL